MRSWATYFCLAKRAPAAILADECERLDRTSGSTIASLDGRTKLPRHRRRLLVVWAADEPLPDEYLPDEAE